MTSFEQIRQEELNEHYKHHYTPVLGTGVLGWLQKNVHHFLERGLSKKFYENIIELGSGKLEHVRNSQLSWISYLATDINISGLEEGLNQVRDRFSNVRVQEMDAQNPNIEKASFDLLIATCLLIHLNDPEKALNEWRNMVKQGGELVIYVPCDPGLLIRVSRNLIVRTKNRKHGCEDYELICAREHKSSLHVLDRYIKNIFNADSIKISTWPIPKLYLWNLNLAYIYTIKKL